MDQKRFKKQIDFIKEIDKEKAVYRQTRIIGGARRENDAEHGWHMAVMIWLLSEYSNESIDIGKTVLMALIHDLVEIYAGDTYAYDTAAITTQKEREEAAADRLFGILPKDQGNSLRELWDEFEKHETAEAKFVHTIDNLQPMLLNDTNNGIDWKERGIAAAQVMERNKNTAAGSKEIWEFMKTILKKNIKEGRLL